MALTQAIRARVPVAEFLDAQMLDDRFPQTRRLPTNGEPPRIWGVSPYTEEIPARKLKFTRSVFFKKLELPERFKLPVANLDSDALPLRHTPLVTCLRHAGWH